MVTLQPSSCLGAAATPESGGELGLVQVGAGDAQSLSVVDSLATG